MIIADTGFWVALGNPKDDYHDLAMQRFKTLAEPLITTWGRTSSHVMNRHLAIGKPFLAGFRALLSRLSDQISRH